MRRIHVTYHLKLEDEGRREAAIRAHNVHADRCPMARTLRDSIAITTELRMEPLPE